MSEKLNADQSHVCIVTGANSGIGKAVAQLLASRGAQTVLVDVVIDDATITSAELSAPGQASMAIAVDVSNEQQVVDMIEKVRAEIGIPSMLCHAAAIQQFGRTENSALEDWRRLIDINLTGTYIINKAVLPSLLETTGSLVNVASLAGNIGLPYVAAYSASKGGVIALTKALAKEYSDRDLRINAIAPGAVDTPMYATAPPDDINPKALGVIPRSAREASSPQDIASLIAYLLCDAPLGMTGSVVSIDGASS